MSTLDFTNEEPELTEEDLARYEEIDRQQELENERYGVEQLLRLRSARLQRDAAREKANIVRTGIADVKREIRAGALSVGEALLDPRSASIRTSVLLQAQHRWGPHRAERLCRAAGVNHIRRVGELTDRQRTALSDALTERKG